MDELTKYSKTNPFKIPENYFDDFEKKLFSKISQEEIKNRGKRKIRSLKPYLVIAASFLLIFSLWFVFLSKLDLDKAVKNETNEGQDVIYSYFESMDADDLIYLISSDEAFAEEFMINLERDMDLIIDDLDESLMLEEIDNTEI